MHKLRRELDLLTIWNTVDVSLKRSSPQEVKLLGPISILLARATYYLEALLQVAENSASGPVGQGGPGPCMFGLRKGDQCAKPIPVLRS